MPSSRLARSGALVLPSELAFEEPEHTTHIDESPPPDPAQGRGSNLDPSTMAVVLASMPLGVVLEEPGVDCWVNAELRRLWRRPGLTRVRAGELEAALDPAPPRPTGAQTWDQLLADGEIGWRSHLLQRPDGTAIPVRVRRRPIGTRAALGVATYVIEDAPRGGDEDLRRAFLAMVGHELRSPVTSVVAGAELLHASGLDRATRAEVASLLVEEANRVSMLVEQLTTLTLLQSAGSSLAGDPIHLVHLVRKVGSREAARRPGLDLRLPRLASSAAVVLGDEGFIAQVLTILIDNAAKYAGGAGTVEIVIEPDGDEVGVHVLDHGPGLGTSDAERLFELFQRGRADGDGPGGLGIGLYVARQIVGVMHGRVWAHNRAGGGADFGFALPAPLIGADDPV